MVMKFVKVRGPNNRPDCNGRGCVPYEYEIAKCAISNADWCEFLNAIGEKAVAFGLWHKDMETGVLGGIVCSMTSGKDSPRIAPPSELASLGGYASPLRFAAKAGWEKKPVTYVTYTGVMRYCNWLMTGDTEKGAYDLTVTPPRRLKGAKYFLPTDDEWYKAAYWDSQAKRYWKYPTRSNEIPSQEQANFERDDHFSQLALTPQSSQTSKPPNLQTSKLPNLQTSKPPNLQTSYYYLADVDAYADSPSPCGALQMGGNVWEFIEDCFDNPLGNKLRGGSFGYTETGLSAANVDFGKYDKRCYVFGARICRMKDGWRPMPKPLKCVIIQQIRNVIARCKSCVIRLLSCG